MSFNRIGKWNQGVGRVAIQTVFVIEPGALLKWVSVIRFGLAAAGACEQNSIIGRRQHQRSINCKGDKTMVRHFRMATLTSLLLGALLPGHAPAFQVDGFWTGMSTQQLVSVAANNGLVARPAADGYWFIGTSIPPRVLGKFGFCGNYLVSYTRNIHSDADYANTLAAIFATYGPPRKMNFSGDVESGSADGAFRASGETQWERGGDRVRMTSYFDWRLYRGELRREQPASVRFETRNPCGGF